MADKMSIDKKDAVKEDSGDESIGSSPENEPGPANNSTQENQQPKRKGGRKPVRQSQLSRLLSLFAIGARALLIASLFFYSSSLFAVARFWNISCI